MPSRKTVEKICENSVCEKHFFVRPVEARRGQGRFCSRSCKSIIMARLTAFQGSREQNANWKGGRTKSTRGYWYILMPEHHRVHKNGYTKVADLVLEAKLGRLLLPNEIAHHKNEITDDDRPENLEPMDEDKHRLWHLNKRREKQARNRVEKVRKPDHPCNRRYEWPSNEDLLELKKQFSLRQIATQIGCGHKSVDLRIKRIFGVPTIR